MYSVRHPARRYDREYIAYPISVFSLCVAGSICRCGSVGKHGGFCFFSFPAVSMISCPTPPPPFPLRGRGSPKVYFAGGLRPRHPCTEPPAALARRAFVVLVGRVRGWSLADLAAVVSAGGACPLCRPPTPAFRLLYRPHPPDPLPGGKGETLRLFRRGLPPPAPRALNRLRHLQSLPSRCPAQRGARGSLQKRQNPFPTSSAASQGEGGPGERNFGV